MIKIQWKKAGIKLIILSAMCFLTSCIQEKTANRATEPDVFDKTLEQDAAEASKKKEKVTLTVLYARDDITWSLLMDDLCSKFESENPDINLIMQEQGNGIYEENLKIKEALNEFPDIFEIQNAVSYIDNDSLGEIPESIRSLIEEPRTVGEKVYTIPLYTTTYGIIYNQALFKQFGLKIPKNYEEFRKVCERLKYYGISPIVCGGTKPDSAVYWLNYFYQKNVSAGHEVDFLTNEYKAMLEDYFSLMSSDYILRDSIYMNDSQVISSILTSEAAMYYGKPGFIANIMQADPDCISSNRDNLGAEVVDEPGTVRLSWFFIPMESGDTIAATEVGSQLAISKNCSQDPEKYQAAERFFQFLFEDENYREILKTMYGFQTTKRRILYPAPTVQQGLIVDYRYAQKEESFSDAGHISSAFKNELVQALILLTNQTMSVEETAQYLNQKWMELNE